MSTHKHLDKICCCIMIFALLVTGLLMQADIPKTSQEPVEMDYEMNLFDTSKVHQIEITMDNWEAFLEDCINEEYYACNLSIDGEVYEYVGIRAKGNTSLTQVASYGNDRYSFKIEFDHYNDNTNYYGLDKLCLNNIIQDNTYMKDYLTYQMMAAMGVAAPLCSYAYITVNGEDWGLYLAVEGVEESFLERNYGSDYGELYKPDSQSMGGGHGSGEPLDIDKFDSKNGELPEKMNETSQDETGEFPQKDSAMQGMMPQGETGEPPQGSAMQGMMPQGETGEPPQGSAMQGMMPQGETGEPPQGSDMQGNMPQGEIGEPPQGSGMQGTMPQGDRSEFPQKDSDMQGMMGEKPEKMDDHMHDFINENSDDVLLKYIDDDIDSYPNIFDNAKTNPSTTDKERLIDSLEKLSNGEALEEILDVEAVISYFVVHNFVLNFDSYTGSMIHNYYLYEKDGKMEMIPWDYNLAFGGFNSAGGATNLVNYPIDSPVSGSDLSERPMLNWIFENKEYTELYHAYFQKFLETYFESGYFEVMMEQVSSMIAPYVEKDATKFCTYEEFETGIETLKEFCLLRAESIAGQLDGSIGSTTETQDAETFISAEHIRIEDMGNMGNTISPFH